MPNLKDKPSQPTPVPSNYLIMITNPVTGAITKMTVAEFLNAEIAPDTTPPSFVGASCINSTLIRVICSEVIPVGSAVGWSAKLNGANNPIVSISGFGTATLDITVTNAMAGGDAIRVSYNPGSGNSLDAAGNEFGTITDFVVSNALSGGGGGGGDTTAPTIVSATVEDAVKNAIVVVFSESVSLTTAGWSFLKAGSNWPIASVAGSGNTWTFTMTGDAAFGETLQRSYNPGTGNTVDGASNELASFTNVTVTNNVAASGGGLIHQSTFTAANGTAITAYTPEIGSAWANQSGTAEIQGNEWTPVSAGGGACVSDTTISTAGDYTYRANYRIPAGGGRAYFQFKTNGTGNGVYCDMFLGVLTCGQTPVAGGYATITTITPSPSVNNTAAHEIEFVITGTSVEVFVDGVSQGTFSYSATLSAMTKVGIGCENTSAVFTSFEVE
jgi:hypothetical protein